MAGPPPPPFPPPGGPPPGPGLRAGGAEYPPAPPTEWAPWSQPLTVGPLPGPPPAPQPERRGRGAVAAVVALVVLVAVVAGVVLVATADGDDGGEDVAGGPTPTTDATTSTTGPTLDTSPGGVPSVPGLPFDPSEGIPDPQELARPLDEVLPGIVSFVERERGHRFVTPPVVEALSEEEFLAAFREGQGDQPVDDLVVLRAIGALEEPGDVAGLLDEGVQGFYDPESGRLVVRGDLVTPLVQTVIAHELTHALDDQLLDLQRLDALAERDDESAFGLQALAEGSARVVERAFLDEVLTPEEQAAAFAERLGLDDPGSLPDTSAAEDLLALGLYLTVPYGDGAELVDAILAQGGTPALDAAFRSPPTTSEQVLDPAVFLAGEPAVAVPAPAADGPVVDQGAFGAVDVRLLEAVGDPMGVVAEIPPEVLLEGAATFEPVDGFGGGSYVAWEDGERACVRAALVGDDPQGTAAVEEVVQGWADAVGDVEVSTAGGRVTFTSCR